MKVLRVIVLFGLVVLLPAKLLSQPKQNFRYYDKPVNSILEDLCKRFKNVSFIYSNSDLAGTTNTTIVMLNSTLTEFLDSLCRVQPIQCKQERGRIYISKAKSISEWVKTRSREITIRVADIRNRPIRGATVSILETNIVGATDKKGEFKFLIVGEVTRAVITHVGYTPDTISTDSNPILSYLKNSVAVEKPQILNYTINYPKLSTGSIVHIDSLQLGQRPGKNLLAGLNATTTGLISVTANGSYGVLGKLQIRSSSWLNLVNGVSAVTQNAPLIIIDHVPLPSVIVSQLDFIGGTPNAGGSSASGAAILRGINMDDIESIEVLKDAEATALYGTKGANGVIIINTKKAKKGQPLLTYNFDAGIARSRINLNYLHTKQYLQARKEAFTNDNQPITEENAPDLTTFDSTRYVDYKDYLLGATANTIRAGITHGQANEQFGYRVRVGYYHEGSVLRGDLLGKKYYDQDIDIRGNLYQKSKDGKFSLSISGSYLDGKTNSISQDITAAISLAPNAPPLIDSLGKVQWYKEFINPLPYFLYQYKSDMDHISGRSGLRYAIDSNITLITNLAMLIHKTDEQSFKPITAQNPLDMPYGEATFASLYLKNIFGELMGEFKRKKKELSTTVLLGTSFMRQTLEKAKIEGTNYNSDILLPFLKAAGDIKATNSVTKYGYVSFFGNGKSVYRDRYALSLSVRGDGSSRFGAKRKYGLFGGIGLGWTISREKFFPDSSIISYLKLKVNYGTSGNDEIGDFVYKGLWAANSGQRPYAGVTTFYPTAHMNNEYGWGLCRKFEISTDINIKNILQLTASFYHNSYTNQIVLESLPNFTGFGSIIKNNKSKTISKGLEISIRKNIVENDSYNWTVSANATFPRTKLKYFPGLATSNYANSLTLGVPVNAQKGLLYLGINDQTGLYEFLDLDKNGQFTRADYIVKGSLDPVMYGGLQNLIEVDRFTLDFSWEFAIQKGINHLLNYNPMRFNQNAYSNIPVELFNRWQKPGDEAAYQMYSATTGSQALSNLDYLRGSDLQLVNANYLRLKMICLSYEVKPFKLSRNWPTVATIYAVAENALLFTKYLGADPLSQNGSGIPLLKRYSLGIKLNIH